MNNKIKLSVLIPLYNRRKYLEECIKSILSQNTDFDFNIIITDDCSTDGSLEVALDIQNKYPDKIIVLPSNKNQKLLSNIIKAYRILNCEYFCVLDPDDYYTDNDFLKKAVDFLELHPDYNIYASNTRILYGNNSSALQIHIDTLNTTSTFEDLLDDKAILGHTSASVFRNCVINEELIKKMEKYIGDFYSEHSVREDDFRNRIHIYNSKAYFVNDVVSVYRKIQSGLFSGSNNLRQVLMKTQAYIDMYYFFDKKYYKFVFLALKQLNRLQNEAFNFNLNNIIKYPVSDIMQMCSILKELYSFDKNYVSNIISKSKMNNNLNISNKFFDNIFSVRNEYKNGIKTRKIVTLCGLKLKLKTKAYSKKCNKYEEKIKLKKQVSLSGFYYSGSSAALGFLSEFDNTTIYGDIDTLFSKEGSKQKGGENRFFDYSGFYELLEAFKSETMNLMEKDDAIKKFIKSVYNGYNNKSMVGWDLNPHFYNDTFLKKSEDFIKNILDFNEYDLFILQSNVIPYRHYSNDTTYEKCSFMNLEGVMQYLFYRFRNIEEKQFDELVKKYLMDLFTIQDSLEYVIYDQMIPPSRLEIINYYLKEYAMKQILVYRDPRDQFLSAYRDFNDKGVPRTAKGYIEWYKINVVPYINGDNPDVLPIRFEDLVLDYDNQTKKIMNFLGIDIKHHINPRTVFEPEISKKNIGAFKSFHDKEFMEKVGIELREYCYNL